MDEQKDGKTVWTGRTTCACGQGCACGCGCARAHRIGWWIAGIVILFIAFFIGVAFGRFSDRLHTMYGGYYYRAYPMMQGGYYGGGATVSPANPVVPVNGAAGASSTAR